MSIIVVDTLEIENVLTLLQSVMLIDNILLTANRYCKWEYGKVNDDFQGTISPTTSDVFLPKQNYKKNSYS